jgi:hypothetical protein
MVLKRAGHTAPLELPAVPLLVCVAEHLEQASEREKEQEPVNRFSAFAFCAGLFAAAGLISGQSRGAWEVEQPQPQSVCFCPEKAPVCADADAKAECECGPGDGISCGPCHWKCHDPDEEHPTPR